LDKKEGGMAISVSGRVVKAKRAVELRRAANLKPQHRDALGLNHIRIQFQDGSERHWLFDDATLFRAEKRAVKSLGEKPKATWVREVWYDGLIKPGLHDVADVISRFGLPAAARRYNHVRLEIGNRERHFLFTDNEIENGLSNTKLPKVSWLTETASKGIDHGEGSREGVGEGAEVGRGVEGQEI
jgi:hypothetical protein